MMQSFENVWRSLFSQSDWGWKCLVGGILMAFPVINFFALGYLSRLLEDSRRGLPLSLPEWDDWRKLFVDGWYFFVILVVFAGGPLAVAYLLSRLPVISLLGPLAYVPMIPAILLAGPLSAASLYRFQSGTHIRDAFEIKRLFGMLQAEPEDFVVPTLAWLGVLLAGAPVLPLAFFVGAVPVMSFYFLLFHRLEAGRPAGPAGPYSFL